MFEVLLRSLAADAAEITRQFNPDLEVRSDGTGRTIAGIVVPFDHVARVSDGGPSYDESFQRGAFAKTIAERGDRVKLLSQHMAGRNPLGRAVTLREDGAGLYGEFKVSRTQAGDEALELVRDGALDSFSVGFSPVQHRMDGKVKVRTEVALREASLVTFPAYEGARITAVRTVLLDEFEAMSPEERAEFAAALARLSATPDAEPVDVGTPDGAAAQVEPTLSHSARFQALRLAARQKGVLS